MKELQINLDYKIIITLGDSHISHVVIALPTDECCYSLLAEELSLNIGRGT